VGHQFVGNSRARRNTRKLDLEKKYHIPKLERIKNIPVKKAKTKDTHNNQSLSIQKPNKL